MKDFTYEFIILIIPLFQTYESSVEQKTAKKEHCGTSHERFLI